jgi:hypothetical protein
MFYASLGAPTRVGPPQDHTDGSCIRRQSRVEVADRFPDKASQFLRNIQSCFKELPRVPGIEYRSGMASAANPPGRLPWLV